ncbi:hypothetical protein PM082_021600 [Marasmius tenuissimus]|nr:hypothetical protein PM082_021600 [Marasmius tenuissimus]
MSGTLLLKNGTVLVHDDNDKVIPTEADILVEGNVIARVAPGISPPSGAEVIDCTNKIISPGFVDVHQHVWQTLNKGIHGDHTLLGYMAPGNMTSNIHTREDLFWGQLGGCLNLLNAGTTTVVDHAHLNVFSGASETAVLATASSGIRSFFCYTPTTVVKSWNPLDIVPNVLEPWVLSDLSSLIQKAPFNSNGRVQLGLGFDSWFLPEDVAAPLFDIARQGGIKVLTAHSIEGAISFLKDIPGIVHRRGLLGNAPDKFRLVISHGNGISQDQADFCVKHNVYVVSTPSTELQMGHGRPVCFDDNIRAKSCLGGDCHSNGGHSIPGEMRLGLQAERGMRNQNIIDHDKAIKSVHRTVEQAFNLGTIQGARAVGMEDKIGSIKAGKLADLVVFDAASPAMICAAQNKPVTAVVLFSTPGDVETVIVDGVVRKSEGKLRPTQLEAGASAITQKQTLEWRDIGKHILERQASYRDRHRGVDFQTTLKAVTKSWGLDEAILVDEV